MLRNAKAYARWTCFGVVAPFNFGCAQIEIPIANQAPRCVDQANGAAEVNRAHYAAASELSVFGIGARLS